MPYANKSLLVQTDVSSTCLKPKYSILEYRNITTLHALGFLVSMAYADSQ